jgi:hypothetical protein
VKNTADVAGGKPIAVLLQSLSGVSAIYPLVAFYDIHRKKREVLLFCPGHHTNKTRHTHAHIILVEITGQIQPLFPTHRDSCIARIYSDKLPIDNEQ